MQQVPMLDEKKSEIVALKLKSASAFFGKKPHLLIDVDPEFRGLFSLLQKVPE